MSPDGSPESAIAHDVETDRCLRACRLAVKDYPTAHLHIDAAWAGMAYACPEFRDVLKLDDVNKVSA